MGKVHKPSDSELHENVLEKCYVLKQKRLQVFY
jgi:hypothetical protein